MKKLKTLTGRTFTAKKAVKKIGKDRYYKFIVVALDRDKNVVSTSKIIHVATKGGTVCNYKSVKTKAKRNRIVLRRGKTFRLAAKGVPASLKRKVKRHVGIRYVTSKKKVATVSKAGYVKGVKKGTCYIYAYAQNGVYAKISVTVK